MEDASSPKKMKFHVSKEQKPEPQASKRRKVVQKTVVTVRTEANAGNQKSEGPPSDFWSWRKYGQKPIKGSPYPRGYYRCSTSKGCSAKKQVERSRTDASMLIITYTSSHNHPGPERPTTSPTQEPKEAQTQTIEDPSRSPKQDQSIITGDEDDHFHYLQINGSLGVTIDGEENPNPLEKINDSIDLLFDEEPLSYPHLMTFSTPKSEENDFFDELEELPIPSSSLTSFMRSNFFDERILILPS